MGSRQIERRVIWKCGISSVTSFGHSPLILSIISLATSKWYRAESVSGGLTLREATPIIYLSERGRQHALQRETDITEGDRNRHVCEALSVCVTEGDRESHVCEELIRSC